MAPRKPVTVDLDLDALAKEATDSTAPFSFRIHGHVLTIASGDDSDFRVLDALSKNDLTSAIQFLLGPDQYTKFTEKPVSMKTLKAVLEGWSNHKGLTLGE
jgi:hypothetical protein